MCFFLLLPPLLPYSPVSQAAFRLPVQVTEMACVKWLPAISTIQIFIYVCLFSLPYSNQIDGLREMACMKWPPAISPIQIFIYVCLFFKNCTVPKTESKAVIIFKISSKTNWERRAYFRSIYNKYN